MTLHVMGYGLGLLLLVSSDTWKAHLNISLARIGGKHSDGVGINMASDFAGQPRHYDK
jgi:hypothetical protein